MAECSEEAVLNLLRARGGKVKNSDLIQHFKDVFPEDPNQRAEVRNRFKQCVDGVAVVRVESGVKYVCLKKKFRGSVKEPSHCRADSRSRQVSDVQVDVAPPPPSPPAACGGQQAASCYRKDEQVAALHEDESRTQSYGSVCVEQVESSLVAMGNTETLQSEKRLSGQELAAPDIPQISVIEASPLPAQGSVFSLPEPAQTGTTGQVEAGSAGLDPSDTETETAAEQSHVVTRGQSDDEGQFDTQSLSGSGGTSSPRGSRRHFIRVMVNQSPELRRSLVLRPSLSQSSRDEADSASLVSNLDEDRPSVSLEPLEHEWMMCASDGEWASLHRLLTVDPSLVLRKDFVSGFTCLHWAAKHGKPELMALIVTFAKQHDVDISVDVRSNTGYTPLHVAAMHNHMEVVKLLVGAYNADVEIRDYSGRKACQYLTHSVSLDIRDIIGAYEQSDLDKTDKGEGGRWRFSKVLQSNLKPLRLLSTGDSDSVDIGDGPREKPLRRKSSLSRMKPKLQKLRTRTSQIVQSTSFHETDELSPKGSMKGSFKSRPKTHFFG